MGLLLFILGILAGLSGGIKARSRRRHTLNIPWLVNAEIAVGVVTIVGSGLGLARARPLAWTIVFVLLLVVLVSLVAHARRAVRVRSRWEESEAQRLQAYLRSHASPLSRVSGPNGRPRSPNRPVG